MAVLGWSKQTQQYSRKLPSSSQQTENLLTSPSLHSPNSWVSPAFVRLLVLGSDGQIQQTKIQFVAPSWPVLPLIYFPLCLYCPFPLILFVWFRFLHGALNSACPSYILQSIYLLYESFACMYVCQKRAPDHPEPEPPYGCWELNLGPGRKANALSHLSTSIFPPLYILILSWFLLFYFEVLGIEPRKSGLVLSYIPTRHLLLPRGHSTSWHILQNWVNHFLPISGAPAPLASAYLAYIVP